MVPFCQCTVAQCPVKLCVADHMHDQHALIKIKQGTRRTPLPSTWQRTSIQVLGVAFVGAALVQSV